MELNSDDPVRSSEYSTITLGRPTYKAVEFRIPLTHISESSTSRYFTS